MSKYFTNIYETINTLWTGMRITWRHMIHIRRDNVTLQYPEERWPRPERNIGFDHKDEVLAKTFNENLVSIVNNFYNKTKTLKTGLNMEILQRQADSIKMVLDTSIMMLAETDQSIPNPNPLTKVSLVPYQKAMIDVQANGAIYQELLKQLELAKVTHRNKMPLIQIIDKPDYPLESSKWKLLKTLVYGLIFGFSISVLFLSLRRTTDSL